MPLPTLPVPSGGRTCRHASTASWARPALAHMSSHDAFRCASMRHLCGVGEPRWQGHGAPRHGFCHEALRWCGTVPSTALVASVAASPTARALLPRLADGASVALAAGSIAGPADEAAEQVHHGARASSAAQRIARLSPRRLATVAGARSRWRPLQARTHPSLTGKVQKPRVVAKEGIYGLCPSGMMGALIFVVPNTAAKEAVNALVLGYIRMPAGPSWRGRCSGRCNSGGSVVASRASVLFGRQWRQRLY